MLHPEQMPQDMDLPQLYLMVENLTRMVAHLDRRMTMMQESFGAGRPLDIQARQADRRARNAAYQRRYRARRKEAPGGELTDGRP
jgi:hypothetical protein